MRPGTVQVHREIIGLDNMFSLRGMLAVASTERFLPDVFYSQDEVMTSLSLFLFLCSCIVFPTAVAEYPTHEKVLTRVFDREPAASALHWPTADSLVHLLVFFNLD